MDERNLSRIAVPRGMVTIPKILSRCNHVISQVRRQAQGYVAEDFYHPTGTVSATPRTGSYTEGSAGRRERCGHWSSHHWHQNAHIKPDQTRPEFKST
jgi:hypothetical protein